jgi:two-component system, OmpR family, sensor histidine kinase KdpD
MTSANNTDQSVTDAAGAATQTGSSRAAVRVLVAIGINPDSQRLLHTAARLAEGLGGELIAIHVQAGSDATSLYRANRDRHLQQARDLGATTEIVTGTDVAATLVRFARTRDVTHLVVGQSDISRWREVTRGSVVNRMLRLIQEENAAIDLYIVTASSRF